MRQLSDKLGPAECAHFAMLCGHHPRRVGVDTHRDAINYLTIVDAIRRERRKAQSQRTQAARPGGLLALTMRGRYG